MEGDNWTNYEGMLECLEMFQSFKKTSLYSVFLDHLYTPARPGSAVGVQVLAIVDMVSIIYIRRQKKLNPFRVCDFKFPCVIKLNLVWQIEAQVFGRRLTIFGGVISVYIVDLGYPGSCWDFNITAIV